MTTTPFKDFDEVFDDSITLPVRGKVYVIHGPDAEVGIWIQRLAAAGLAIASGQDVPAGTPSLTLDDNDEESLYKRVLGDDVYNELIADGVPWEALKHVAQTTVWWIAAGVDAALEYWNSGGAPKKQPAPNRSGRRASAKTTRAAGASTTKSPNSGRTTRSKATPGKR